ncbi:MAG: class E sortase [Candidatus Saccharibacteria bacterium]|nr:class E sortase [Candidatus Saccharibacteria bacterium]
MDQKNGGLSSSDLQRRAAAEIARKKVLAAYAKTAQKNAQEVTQSHLKDTPVDPKINSESWKKYHSAWQDYYQKYYSEYYSNAARNYVAREKLKEAREQAEEEEIISAIAKAGGKGGSTGLKMKVQKKAAEEVKKNRRFRKFIPLFAGLTVVLVILFLQYNRLIFAPIMAYVSPGNAPASEIEAIDPTITQTVSSDPRLIIPKLNVDVPIRFGVALDGVMAAMNNGVAHYRIAGASAYPGQIGNFIITGHSAGDIYSSNPYKYIFSGLERLEDGDLIYVNYESVRYTYRVVKKEVIEPTNVQALVVQTDKPLLTLVTCTPLGTSRYRLLVTAEQISPSYEGSSEDDIDTETPVTEEVELPANEPSFFEGIWNWMTGN